VFGVEQRPGVRLTDHIGLGVLEPTTSIKRDNPDYRRRRRAVSQLEQLGYQVALEPTAA
jgi:hypothetical protein